MQTSITEQELQTLEDNIPKLAQKAFKKAYTRALDIHGHVLIARNGQLIDSMADGTLKTIKPLNNPIKIAIGTIRNRTRKK